MTPAAITPKEATRPPRARALLSLTPAPPPAPTPPTGVRVTCAPRTAGLVVVGVAGVGVGVLGVGVGVVGVLTTGAQMAPTSTTTTFSLSESPLTAPPLLVL